MMSSRSGGISSHNNNTRSNVPDAATNVSGPSADRRKSGDFSISAILSEDTGGSSRKAKVTPVRGRERSTSSGMLVSPPGHVIPMSTPSRCNPHSSNSHFTPTTATPTSHWVQSGALNQSVSLSPFNINLLLLASSPTGSDVGSSQGSLGIETEKDGDKLSCNDSLGMLSTVAMYHSGLSEGSGGEGEQAENEGGRRREKMSSVPAAVGDGLAQMRLESSSDTADTTLSVEDRRSTPPPPHSPSSSSTQTRSKGKGTTPFILKRDRKRRRQLAGSFAAHTSSNEVTKSINSHQSSSHPHTEHPAPLDTGFLSPTSAQKSPRHTNLSFSPSIFLSRPTNTSTDRSLQMDTSSLRHDSSSTTSIGTHGGRNDVSVTHESDGTTESALREGCDKNHDQCSSSVSMERHSSTVPSFATSTPIKKDKENTRTTGYSSPTYLSPSESSDIKRPRLRDTTHDTSSGSDSEVPMKKCRSRSHALQHRSKARAQLSPLLENACSPISKTEQRPPSSLLTANFPTSSTATATFNLPGIKEPLPRISVQDPQTPTTPHPPIAMPCLPPHAPPIPFPFSCNPLPPHYPPQPNLYLGMMPVAPNPLFPMSVSPLSPPHTSYFIPPCPPAISPTTAGLLHPSSLYYYNTVSRAYSYPASTAVAAAAAAAAASAGNISQKWGGSPLSMQWEKTGQIQSVPPWFIFEQNRPEGKRLRLTEAINRSLSETPSHNPKLPAEWTKYACGQTDDQRLLTQKARLFLQSGRRQLTFDNINT